MEQYENLSCPEETVLYLDGMDLNDISDKAIVMYDSQDLIYAFRKLLQRKLLSKFSVPNP